MPLSTIFQLYCDGQDLWVEENHCPWARHNVVSYTPHHEREIRTHNFSGDKH